MLASQVSTAAVSVSAAPRIMELISNQYKVVEQWVYQQVKRAPAGVLWCVRLRRLTMPVPCTANVDDAVGVVCVLRHREGPVHCVLRVCGGGGGVGDGI